MYAAYGDTAHVVAVVEAGDEHLRVALEGCWGGDIFDDGVEQRNDVVGGLVPVGRHPALLGRAVDGDELQLVLRGVEAEHEVEDHLLHLVGAAVGLVHLVDDHDGLEANLNCLLQNEARLRHRALEGVHQQQTAVGHVEHALHLAAEVGVSRSVDDVYLCTLVVDGNVFGEDCYATLALQVVVVEDKLAGLLVVAKEIAGAEHIVDQRSLAVVDMRDDGDVADILHRIVFNLSFFNLQR